MLNGLSAYNYQHFPIEACILQIDKEKEGVKQQKQVGRTGGQGSSTGRKFAYGLKYALLGCPCGIWAFLLLPFRAFWFLRKVVFQILLTDISPAWELSNANLHDEFGQKLWRGQNCNSFHKNKARSAASPCKRHT